MGSTPDNSDAVALAGSLLEQKQDELKAAKAPHAAGAVFRTGAGAAAGFVTGIGAVIGGAMAHGLSVLQNPKYKETFRKLEEMGKEAQRTGNKDLTPEMKKTIDEFGDQLVRELEQNSNTMGANIVKHAGGWVGGLTAAGAGLGMLWHMKGRKQEITAAEKEVNSLQRIRDSWQEHVTPAEDKSRDAEHTR